MMFESLSGNELLLARILLDSRSPVSEARSGNHSFSPRNNKGTDSHDRSQRDSTWHYRNRTSG